MYVKVIKPELIFNLPHCRTSLRKLLQKGVFRDEKRHVCKLIQNTEDSSQHTKNRRIVVWPRVWTSCYKLDRKYEACFPNNTFGLGLDLETVVIGGESSRKWRPMIKLWNMSERNSSPVIWITKECVVISYCIIPRWNILVFQLV